jgi:hypothetical protein
LAESFGLRALRRNKKEKQKKTEFTKSSAPCQSEPRNRSSPILVFGPVWDMRLLVPNLVVPGHVVSELRGIRFSDFPFEWEMACNNLPCTTVQAVIASFAWTKLYYFSAWLMSFFCPSVRKLSLLSLDIFIDMQNITFK